MRQFFSILAASVATVALLILAGSAGDGNAGCGGGVKGAQQLCLDTGGKWDDSSCPSYCWPPECGESVLQACIEVCGPVPVCVCPKSTPYWEDGQGCLAASQCPQPPTCAQAGGQCGAESANGVECPASHPTSMPAAGTCTPYVFPASCCI